MADRSGQSNTAATVAIAIGLAVLAIVHLFGSYIVAAIRIAEVVVPALAGIWLLAVIVRFMRASPAARRNYPRTFLARARWRWLARSLELAHASPLGRRKTFGFALGRAVALEQSQGHVRYPKARFRADQFGIVARIRTIPKAGRSEFEDAAEDIANEWKVARCQISQPSPGRLIVRGLVTDPLAVPFGPEGAPGGVWDRPEVARPYLGLSEWAEHRYLSLAGQTGVVIGGIPGRGKTSLIASLLMQWSGSDSIQLACLDGKGSHDYSDWHGRFFMHSDDDLEAAVGLLEDMHALMRRRLALVVQATGHKNSWHAGPSPDWPLVVLLVDECQQYLDVVSYKGDKEREAQARRCVSLLAELVRKGRSAMVVSVVATQKPTSDSIPSTISANAGISLCFGVKTVDAAAAVLGPDIREYGSVSPVGLRDDSMIGVLCSTLPTGADPFTRVRVPEITERAAEIRALETQQYRADPVALLDSAPAEVSVPDLVLS